MARKNPAHLRRGGADDLSGDTTAMTPAEEGGLPPASTSVERALRALEPPRHASGFWTRLDERLADEPQLRLTPRSAIRPITQPPPVVDDSSLASTLKGGLPPPRRTHRRTVVAVVAVLLLALLVVAALQEPDDDAATSDTTTTVAGDAQGGEPASPEETTIPTTTLPPGAIDPAEPLTPAGVGPLRIGATFAELQAAGVQLQVDQATFEGSGGTCYDAKIPGALDLILRFRPPDDRSSVDDPGEGVLASVSIESALPTTRATDSGLVLGSPQDQVLAAYGGNLDERQHPFIAGGRIFRADAGNGLGIAFFTDGLGVVRISVGFMDTIRFINQCR
ncbi:MAG: hypothetical protein C0P77_012555 [Thermoanaerobacterales bacterium]